jgi:hypothetical protein
MALEKEYESNKVGERKYDPEEKHRESTEKNSKEKDNPDEDNPKTNKSTDDA